MTCEEALAKLIQIFPRTACVAETSCATYRRNNPIYRLYIASTGPYFNSWGPDCASFEEAFTNLDKAIKELIKCKVETAQ